MTRPVRWTTRASEQLERAAIYLEKARSTIGLRFVDDIEAVLDAASHHPEIFPAVPDVKGNEVRRGLVRRYGYWVIYEIRSEDLLVLSIWHCARKSEGWREEQAP